MHFDKGMVNLSFNQVVLQCCKNCMAEDNNGESAEDTSGK